LEAARNRHFGVMAYMHDEGFPWGDLVGTGVDMFVHVRRWLRENGYAS
jgi:hypothetical protein